MRIWGKDALRILESKLRSETLQQAAVRVLPHKYKPNPLTWNPPRIENMRIRRPSVQAAMKNRYQKENFHDICSGCFERVTKAMFREYGRSCAVCGSLDNVAGHHIIPRDEACDPNVAGNMMPLCDPCHDFVEDHESKPRTREDCIRAGMDRLG
jgi:5-methylcytosine-specific restriction endonuclease McrA